MLFRALAARGETHATLGTAWIRAGGVRVVGAPCQPESRQSRARREFHHGLLALLGLALLLAACGRRLPASEGTSALRANLVRAGRVELLVPEALTADARAAAQGWELPTEVLALDRDPGGDGGAARVVLGRPDAPLVQGLLAALPLPLLPGVGEPGVGEPGKSLRLLGRRFSWGAAVLTVVVADPERTGLPLTLVVSRNQRRLRGVLPELAPGVRPGLWVTESGEPHLEAQLTWAGRLRPGSVVDRTPRRIAMPDQYESLYDVQGLEVAAADEVARNVSGAWGTELVGLVETLVEWAPVELPQGFHVVLESHLDGFRDGFVGEQAPAELARYDPLEERLTALVSADLPFDLAPLGRALLLAAIGEPFDPWVADAAALDAAGTFLGRDLERWCARLARVRRWTVRELLAPDALERTSPLALRPLRALLWRVLREQCEELGKPFRPLVLSLWEGAAPRPEWGELLAERLTELEAEHGIDLADAARAAGAAALEGTWSGFVVEPPWVQGSHPFGSRGFEQSLLPARELGARAITLRAHFAAQPGVGYGLPRRRDPTFAPLEGDAALLAAMSQARAMGWRVALVPELLASPTGIREAARVLTTAEEWQAFFDRQRAAVLHTALLAELGGAQICYVGFDLPRAAHTVWTGAGQEDPAARFLRRVKASGWSGVTGVIATARAVYGGALAYAAAFPGPLDAVGFWGDLDLAGLALRPDLAGPETPWAVDDDTTRRRLAMRLDRIPERLPQGMPWLVAEVGFRSVVRAHEGAAEPGGAAGAAGALEQARLFRALGDVLAERSAEEWPLGVFVLGWSSDPGTVSERGYSVRGKPAEEELARIFGH